MKLFLAAGAVLILVPAFLRWMIVQKLPFSPKVQLKHTVQTLSDALEPRFNLKKHRKRRIICNSRSSGIIFRPKLKNKESAPKLVYMSYNLDSSTIAFFSNVHHTSETETYRVATWLFDVNLPNKEEKYIISSPLHCHGLFVIPHATNVLICNPKTKEVITLPESNKHTLRSEEKENKGINERVGIGFLQSTHTYKVAQFFYRAYNMEKRTYSMGFEVFTLGISRCWRVLTKDPPYPIRTSCYSFTGKCIYFYIWYHLEPYAPNAFLCFNLKNENFSLLYPPYSLSNIHVDYMRLTNLKNTLCLSTLLMNDTRFVVFTSKQGNNLDWTPRFCFNITLQPGGGIVLPIAEHGGNLLTRVLDKETQRLENYSMKDGSCVEVNYELENLKMENVDVLILGGKPWYNVASYMETLFKLQS